MTTRTYSGAVAMILAAVLLPSSAGAAGFYLGTSLVKAKVDADYSGGSVRSNRDSNLGFHAGYRLGDRIALEASFAKLFDYRGSLCQDVCVPETGSFEFEAERLELAVLGYLPLGRKVELFGKAGAGRVETQFLISPWDLGTSSFDSTDTAAILGAGVAWSPVRRLALRVQYDRHHSGSTDGSAYWAGITFSLGK